MSLPDFKPSRAGVVKISELSPEPGDEDLRIYRRMISPHLTPEQEELILTPTTVHPRQPSVLAVHWHPEWIPLELIRRRIDATFPGSRLELVIPTQHNVLMRMGDYTGVEVDCYAPSFRRKVQLLFHFRTASLEGRGDVFRAMLQHTQKYRASQLFQFIDSVLEPAHEERIAAAAERTGAPPELVEFVRVYIRRLKAVIDQLEAETPAEMVKNKLIRDYFNHLRDRYDDRLINHAQLFLKAVKKSVKRNFSLEYFYEAEEFIEEVRSLGGGVVIPHPEQFWPILLENYDVDGIEVWNPQSYEYTRFLIDVVNRENRTFRRRHRPLLITMGDDCHLGEKIKDPRYQDAAKAGREIGWQPPWEDLAIAKRLIAANCCRERVIQDYRDRLG